MAAMMLLPAVVGIIVLIVLVHRFSKKLASDAGGDVKLRFRSNLWHVGWPLIVCTGLFLLSLLLPVLKRMTPFYYLHMLATLLLIAVMLTIYKTYCFVSDIPTSFKGYTRWLILPIFIALTVFFWHLINLISGDKPDLYQGIPFLQSLHYAWRTFTLENSFEDIRSFTSAIGPAYLADKVYIALLVICAPVLTLLVAISLFTPPSFFLKLVFLRTRDVYIFSDLNDRSIRYAEALHRVHGGKNKTPLIAFCASKAAEDSAVASLNAMNAVVLHRSIDRLYMVFLRLINSRRIHFYLISDDENLKVTQAESLMNSYRKSCDVRFISNNRVNEEKINELNAVFSRKPICSSFLSAAKKDGGFVEFMLEPPSFDGAYLGNVRKCRVLPDQNAQNLKNCGIEFIEEASRALYTEFYNDPPLDCELLEKLCSEDRPATVRILVLGGGHIGAELAKLCLWYFHLPKLKVKVTIADSIATPLLKARVIEGFDEFTEHQKAMFTEPIAVPEVWGDIDFNADTLFAKLDKCAGGDEPSHHIIFVCTGDDDKNYRLSTRLRRFYLRKEYAWGCPEIRTVIWNDVMARLVDPKVHAPMGGVDSNMDYYLESDSKARYNPKCKVDIFGNMSESVWNSDLLEFDALRYNALYSGRDERSTMCPEKKPGSHAHSVRLSANGVFGFYTGLERNRRSSMALAIHGKCKEAWRKLELNACLTDDEKNELLAEVEHERWCIYELLEGHCPVPEKHAGKYYRQKNKGNVKNRDNDETRGYHAGMRGFEQLREIAQDENGARALLAAGCPPDDINWDEWRKAYSNNLDLVVFSHELEEWNAGLDSN